MAQGTTLAGLVARERPGPHGAPAATVDSRPVTRADWGATVLRGGEIVTLRTVLADGGDGGRNPLATVFQVALLIAAIYVPPLLGLNTFWTAAAIGGGGTLVINALFPPRAPDQPRPLEGPSVRPVYSLVGGANRARPYEPLLLVLGTHRLFPDLAAAYAEVAGGEQYLH